MILNNDRTGRDLRKIIVIKLRMMKNGIMNIKDALLCVNNILSW